MRIGFDLTTGTKIFETEIPEDSMLLIAPNQLMLAHKGELTCELESGTLTKGKMVALVAPEDVKRLMDSPITALAVEDQLEENVLVELHLRMLPERIRKTGKSFEDIKEPLELLLVSDGTYPLLLNLEHYEIESIKQVTARVESEVSP